MSSSTPPPEDWVQRRHDEEQELQRSAPELFESLLQSLRLNVESYRSLYSKAVEICSPANPCTIASSDRNGQRQRLVSVYLSDRKLMVDREEGNEELPWELTMAFKDGELHFLARGGSGGDTHHELGSITDASRWILTPVLFPEASTRAASASGD